MRTIILITIFLLFNTNLFSQGGVDVKYIPIDSVDTSYIGLNAKIDFKGKRDKKYLIQKVRHRDTVNILLNNQLIDLIEVKGTGVDYWYFDKEYLKSYNYQSGQFLKIKDIEIQKVEADSIRFQMRLELFRDEQTIKLETSDLQDVWIKRNMLDGILIKK